MNGVKFFRLKHKLSRKDLFERSGVQVQRILHYENDLPIDKMDVTTLCKLASALGTTLSALIQEYDDALLSPGDRYQRPSKSLNGRNVIARYRRLENLSLEQLAERLGGQSREYARQLCNAETAREQYVAALCAYEGISLPAFLARYGEEAAE